jgi:hypothetical protein
VTNAISFPSGDQVDVLLEKEAIDYDGRDGLLLFFLLLGLARIGIMNDKHHTLRIRRPGEVFDAAFHVGEFFGFTTAARQDPELVDLVLVFAT